MPFDPGQSSFSCAASPCAVTICRCGLRTHWGPLDAANPPCPKCSCSPRRKRGVGGTPAPPSAGFGKRGLGVPVPIPPPTGGTWPGTHTPLRPGCEDTGQAAVGGREEAHPPARPLPRILSGRPPPRAPPLRAPLTSSQQTAEVYAARATSRPVRGSRKRGRAEDHSPRELLPWPRHLRAPPATHTSRGPRNRGSGGGLAGPEAAQPTGTGR